MIVPTAHCLFSSRSCRIRALLARSPLPLDLTVCILHHNQANSCVFEPNCSFEILIHNPQSEFSYGAGNNVLSPRLQSPFGDLIDSVMAWPFRRHPLSVWSIPIQTRPAHKFTHFEMLCRVTIVPSTRTTAKMPLTLSLYATVKFSNQMAYGPCIHGFSGIAASSARQIDGQNSGGLDLKADTSLDIQLRASPKMEVDVG